MNDLAIAKQAVREAWERVEKAKEAAQNAPAGPRILASQYEAAERQNRFGLINEMNEQIAAAERPYKVLESAERDFSKAQNRLQMVVDAIKKQRQLVSHYYERTRLGGMFDDVILFAWQESDVEQQQQNQADEIASMERANNQLILLCGRRWNPEQERWELA